MRPVIKTVALMSVACFVGWALQAAFASNSDDRFMYLLVSVFTFPAIIGGLLLFLSNKTNRAGLSKVFKIFGALMCSTSFLISAVQFYRIQFVLPKLAATSNANFDEQERNRMVYYFEESDFDLNTMKVVRWKKPGNREQYIQQINLISIKPELLLIVEKTLHFSDKAFVFDGTKITPVTAKIDETDHEVVGSVEYKNQKLDFRFGFEDVTIGNNIQPVSALMQRVFPISEGGNP